MERAARVLLQLDALDVHALEEQLLRRRTLLRALRSGSFESGSGSGLRLRARGVGRLVLVEELEPAVLSDRLEVLSDLVTGLQKRVYK